MPAAPLRLVLSVLLRGAIFDHALKTPHRECCGLLIGSGEGDVAVARIHPVRNIAAAPEKRFEIDPQEQFDLLRSLRGASSRIVGHYHSHPGGPPKPSAHDLAMAHDPEAVWVIVGLEPRALTAFVCRDQSKGFVQIPVTF